MTDLAELPTQTDDEPGEFTQHMTAAFHRHDELKQLYAAAQKEIAALKKELAALQRGEKTVVIVDGKRFQLVPEGAQVTITNEWRSSEPVTRNPLADSFVL